MHAMTEHTATPDGHELPEHLMTLLQRPIENVMSDVNIQRAHNLAWNRPVSADAEEDIEIDEMVDDTAMRGLGHLSRLVVDSYIATSTL